MATSSTTTSNHAVYQSGGTFHRIYEQLTEDMVASTTARAEELKGAANCIIEEAAEAVHAFEEARRNNQPPPDAALTYQQAVAFLQDYLRAAVDCASDSHSCAPHQDRDQQAPGGGRELVFKLFTTSMTGSRRVRDHDRRLKTLMYCLNIPFEEIDLADNKFIQQRLAEMVLGATAGLHSGAAASRPVLATSPDVFRFCDVALNDTNGSDSHSADVEEGEFPTLVSLDRALQSLDSKGLLAKSIATSTAIRYALPAVFVTTCDEKQQFDERGDADLLSDRDRQGWLYLGTFAELQLMVDEQYYTPGDESNPQRANVFCEQGDCDGDVSGSAGNARDDQRPSLLAKILEHLATS